MKDTLIKYWPLTVVIVGWVVGGTWWAATVQSDLSYVKRDVADIKAIITRGNQTAFR